MEDWENETWAERSARERHEEAQEAAARHAARERFLGKLFGSSDRHDWLAPAAIEDFDDLLSCQAAQLQNAARFTLEDVLSDHISLEGRAKAVGALTRLVQTNIAIAKALRTAEPEAKSKTVRGGRTVKDVQD
ncbi:MAG TPA: hypothetical protein VNU97_00810 [Rhizomicrobium sp.]|nr:hypothetical protein [Rhizomicrobium sp.]